MSSNSEPIMQQLQHDFKELLALVSGPEAFTHSAYSIESRLFRGLLALGKALLHLFFITRAAEPLRAPMLETSGKTLRYHEKRPRDYYSVFGKLTFARPYYYLKGEAGVCPLDAKLSLPKRCYSDLLREWATCGATEGSFRDSASLLQRILSLPLSLQAVETMSAEDAVDVQTFYDSKLLSSPPASPAALPAPEDAASVSAAPGSLLVVQADGKGVPMVQSPLESSPARLGKGEKRGTKKEAIVTTLYTVAPYVRTPQEVLAALLREQPESDEAKQDKTASSKADRPRPVDKELRATLDGKATAIGRLSAQAAAREQETITAKVALSDGAEALQQQILTHLPGYTLVLDIIHAGEYLWDTANALLGEKHSGRLGWLSRQLGAVLSGDTQGVISGLQQELEKPDCSETQRKAFTRTIGYYQRNLPYMRYDHYLAQGWPIGTGVVEGACAHLVKDRMEQSGMRWTKAGAQAVLDLRSVRLSGHWDAYWQFHREQQHHRLYGSSPATVPCNAGAEDTPETQMFRLAA
ncbi:MAG: ISKra4 family transposase [Gemmatimonadota bacterium]|nr:ISKra4 family transposase [Gemmatimonadota bacterium]